MMSPVSEPKLGSVRHIVPCQEPSSILGTKRSRSSCVPKRKIKLAAPDVSLMQEVRAGQAAVFISAQAL